MKNTTSEEDGKRNVLLAILITIIAVVAFLVPMPPEEQPQDVQVPHLIEEAQAAPETKEVRIATTSNHIVEADKMVVEKPVHSDYEDLADAIIECESSGRNIEIIDTNGKYSRGIAMFQDETWAWMSRGAGVTGVATEPEKARTVLIWALENGYGGHWYTCYHKVIGY